MKARIPIRPAPGSDCPDEAALPPEGSQLPVENSAPIQEDGYCCMDSAVCRSRGVWSWPSRLLGAALVGLVYVYKFTLSPWLGNACRFTPTCSTYFIEAVRKYGPVVGTVKGVGRILRCHPWHKGGYDPP